MERTQFLGSLVRPNGYNGSRVRVYLCYEPGGLLLMVHRHGFFSAVAYDKTFETASEAIDALWSTWESDKNVVFDVPLQNA